MSAPENLSKQSAHVVKIQAVIDQLKQSLRSGESVSHLQNPRRISKWALRTAQRIGASQEVVSRVRQHCVVAVGLEGGRP
jgi:hypothetical protein